MLLLRRFVVSSLLAKPRGSIAISSAGIFSTKRSYSLDTTIGSLATGKENAYDMSATNIRFGRGSSCEVGLDVFNMGITKKVCVFTDKTIVNLAPFKTVSESLNRANVEFETFDDVQVEPTDKSLLRAIDFCKKKQVIRFLRIHM